MKWSAKIRNQAILLSVILQLVIFVIVVVFWWIAQQPPPPYGSVVILGSQTFFALLFTPIGWLIILAISGFSTLMGVRAARAQLRQLGSPPQRKRRVLPLLGVIGFFAVLLVVSFVWGHAIQILAYLFLLTGLGIPAVWPTSVVYRRWAKQHQQTLIRQRGVLRGVSESET